jgi:hypothetical protein
MSKIEYKPVIFGWGGGEDGICGGRSFKIRLGSPERVYIFEYTPSGRTEMASRGSYPNIGEARRGIEALVQKEAV